jgi:general secretion pathway protein J
MTDRRRSEAGFTLIELLISIAILGLIMLTLFGSLRFGTRVWDRTQRQTASIADIARTQALLRREIGQAYPAYVVTDPTHGAIDFSGEAQSVSFLGPAPRSLVEAGRARVTFRTARKDDGLSLIMEARPELASSDSAARSEVLLDHIASLKFSYFGQPDSSTAAAWQDSWPSGTHLPTLIRIEAEMGGKTTNLWPVLVIAPVITADVSCRYDPLIRDCQGR